jgi:hypothetical protein
LFNGLLEVVPEQRRPTYIALFNLLINVTACISPLVATTLANSLGVVTALYIGGSLRVLGFLAYLLLLRT